MLRTAMIATLLLVSATASAAEVTLSGGADLVGGALVGDGLTFAGGLREVEGAVRVEAGPVRARLDLDLGLDVDGGAFVSSLGLEHATVGVDAGSAYLDAGVATAPWRVESVDPWERAFTTEWGGARRAPGQMAGATLGFGSPDRGVALVGGLGIGAGAGAAGAQTASVYGDGAELDAIGGFAGVRDAPFVLGAHGRLAESSASDATRLTGGAWVPLGDLSAGGVELGGRWTGEPIALQGEAVAGFDGSARVMASVEIFPSGDVRPALRGAWDGGPAGALAVTFVPIEWVLVRAEAGYAGGIPSGWLEIAAFHDARPAARRGSVRRK